MTALVDLPLRVAFLCLISLTLLCPANGAVSCTPCNYVSESQNASRVKLTTTKGYGRTGNYAIAMLKALHLGYACKTTVELPAKDRKGGLSLNEAGRFFDFSQRPGLSVPGLDCEAQYEGNTAYFWFLEMNVTNFSDHNFKPPEEQEVWHCLREYFGFCQPGFCDGVEFAGDDVVVAHVRQGDIYPSNYGRTTDKLYAQPPFSYYLSVLSFVKPRQFVLVGSPGNPGPVWRMFDLLAQHNITSTEIAFVSNDDFYTDLKTLVCAHNLVESKSSLMIVTRMGFASRRFAYDCHLPFPDVEAYKVDFGPMHDHDNTAASWVEDLLYQQTFEPSLCNA